MAKQCFCGCGRKVPKFPIGSRAINTRGKQVAERLDYVDGEWPHLKGESPEIADWVKQGTQIRADLVAAVHGERNPADLDESSIRAWQAEGRNIEHFINQNIAAVGKWAAEQGYDSKEAAEAIGRGEYQHPGAS